MSTMSNVNLKVLVMDSDYYALQAINSYLAWDRRTRVTWMAENLDEMWSHQPHAARGTAGRGRAGFRSRGGCERCIIMSSGCARRSGDVIIVCMARVADVAVEAAADAGARGYAQDDVACKSLGDCLCARPRLHRQPRRRAGGRAGVQPARLNHATNGCPSAANTPN
ncbi:MAG: hypothetical protein U0521_09015 [Anaerolineae bacterium]